MVIASELCEGTSIRTDKQIYRVLEVESKTGAAKWAGSQNEADQLKKWSDLGTALPSAGETGNISNSNAGSGVLVR